MDWSSSSRCSMTRVAADEVEYVGLMAKLIDTVGTGQGLPETVWKEATRQAVSTAWS